MTKPDVVVKSKLIYVVFSRLMILGQCLLVAGDNLLYGQSPPYVVDHYTSENGLPQNSIKYLLFDKNDYLWMASESGLIGFDNKELKGVRVGQYCGIKR